MTSGATPGGRPDPRAITLRVFAGAFGYAAVAALLIQLVVLPHLLPAWHAGSGLLAGGDWVTFHKYAVRRAERIRTQGWQAFELRPLGHAPVGVASAIYALTRPEPWTLIPFNALLHAAASALLFRLLRGFVRSWRLALLGTLPFVLYPSALIWVSQLHKDGLFIAGNLCLFVAWADLARRDSLGGPKLALLASLGLLPAGFALVSWARPDLTILAHAAAALALLVLGGRLAAQVWRDPPRWRARGALLAVLVGTTVGSAWLTTVPSRFVGPGGTLAGPGRPGARQAPIWLSDPTPSWDEPRRGTHAIPWDRSGWLPRAVDRAAYRLALTREVFLVNYLDGRSNVDVHVGLYRATDVLGYLPRALQIALLAPFPSHWRQSGSLTWTTAGRRVVAAEMLGVYGALLALAAVAWRWRQRGDLWVVVLPCLAILGIYSLVVSNLGALHRFRYGFLMVLVGLGVAGGLELLARRRPRPACEGGEPATGGGSREGLDRRAPPSGTGGRR